MEGRKPSHRACKVICAAQCRSFRAHKDPLWAAEFHALLEKQDAREKAVLPVVDLKTLFQMLLANSTLTAEDPERFMQEYDSPLLDQFNEQVREEFKEFGAKYPQYALPLPKTEKEWRVFIKE